MRLRSKGILKFAKGLKKCNVHIPGIYESRLMGTSFALCRYNKSSCDFGSHRDYCDFEEMVEDISIFAVRLMTMLFYLFWRIYAVYNLTEGIDVDETNSRVEQYKKDNADVIISQQTKWQEDMRSQEAAIQDEKRQLEQLQQSMQVTVVLSVCSKSILPNIQETNEYGRKLKRDLINQTNQVMLGVSFCLHVNS